MSGLHLHLPNTWRASSSSSSSSSTDVFEFYCHRHTAFLQSCYLLQEIVSTFGFVVEFFLPCRHHNLQETRSRNSGWLVSKMQSPVKKLLLTSNGDDISQNLAFHLAKQGCRLVLMGNKSCLRSVSQRIGDSLNGLSIASTLTLEMVPAHLALVVSISLKELTILYTLMCFDCLLMVHGVIARVMLAVFRNWCLIKYSS